MKMALAATIAAVCIGIGVLIGAMDPSVGTKQGYACGCVDYEAPWLGSRP